MSGIRDSASHETYGPNDLDIPMPKFDELYSCINIDERYQGQRLA